MITWLCVNLIAIAQILIDLYAVFCTKDMIIRCIMLIHKGIFVVNWP